MELRTVILGSMIAACVPQAAEAGDRETVAALDTAFQDAVKRSDVTAMSKFLHEDFVMVLGDGKVVTRESLLERVAAMKYEQQDEEPGTQTVRLYGDTAVVTARIWLKGAFSNGKTFDRRVWFRDIYVRTPAGWLYVFGQAGAPGLSQLTD
jgi:ketosteroid isomerase-like protein